ncbi:hypothetical protein BDZ94DRAFT_1257570 [Collybia nuda]|uniref:Uncharacterized protein n=1 Tax=Collybia nuda TaxID=64659 RepID=A0A9P5Y7Y8_9AGAR|nr:hypothetical protein BDZ94DRAFT_1257570 [Collybia nuda]
MPISFTVATHAANVVHESTEPATSAFDFLHRVRGDRSTGSCVQFLQGQTSPPASDFVSIRSEENGFVQTVIKAYNDHHHLVIRPDDVWVAILTQFNFYVNAHAEELRSQFVDHDGKRELVVITSASMGGADFGALARQMTGEIHKNVVDDELRDWILPNFSTTSHDDTVVCAITMMSTLKAYFTYKFSFGCGLPSVTLEGERADWERLVLRLEKLSSFGPEPAAWVKLLRPILSRFVRAFDGDPDIDFWNKICDRRFRGSGAINMTGWLTAFCVWSEQGKWQAPCANDLGDEISVFGSTQQNAERGYVLDGVRYPVIYNIAVGFCEVDVKLVGNEGEVMGMMVAGHIGRLTQGELRDTVRPLLGWFVFVKG